MLKITTQERMLQNLAVEYEKLADPRLPACSRKVGHLVETSCTIMDLKGVGIGKVPSVYSYLKQVSGMSQNYYPERMGKLYLINAPWGFSTVFSVVKGWLDPVTVEKIHVLGSNYQKDILTAIPAENLPETFGGQCNCEGGCMFSDQGPWTEDEWKKPAAWELPEGKSDEQHVIKNEGAVTGTVPEGAQTEGSSAAPADNADEIKAAPAALQ
jgi:hypothetical protein